MSRLKHKFDLINHGVYKPRQCVFTDVKVAIISTVTAEQIVISVRKRHAHVKKSCLVEVTFSKALTHRVRAEIQS